MNWTGIRENGVYRLGGKKGKRRPRWRKGSKKYKVEVLNRAADAVTPVLEGYRKRMVRVPTPAEKEFKGLLKECGLSKLFKPQVVLFGYIVDFFSSRLLLGIEIDGGYHLSDEQRRNDKHRERVLLKNGVKLIRFTNDEVFGKREQVRVELIKRFSRFTRFPKMKEVPRNSKIYFAGEQTQEQLRALVPSLMPEATA